MYGEWLHKYTYLTYIDNAIMARSEPAEHVLSILIFVA
jgi:hypothetical protein